MLKLKLLLLLWLLGVSVIWAQPLVRVSGHILDENAQPLSQVTVSVLGQQASALSDQEGSYTIYSRATSFSLKFNLLGYKPVLLSIKEKSAGRLHRDVVMAINVNELEQVTITNKRNQLSNATALNINDLPYLPSVSGNFESLLKILPGVSVNNELSAQYSVRGGNFDENLIYVNDVEMDRPILIRQAQQEGLSFVNTDLLSRARFSVGGYEARYGDKLSSVLDAHYERPDSNSFMINAGFLGASLALKQVHPHDYLLFGLRYKNNNSVLQTQDVKGSYQPHFGDAQFLYQHRFSDKWRIELFSNVNMGRFRLVPESRETLFGTMDTPLRLHIDYSGQEIDDYRHAGAALTTRFSPHPQLVLKWINSYFSSRERERFDLEGAYLFDEEQPDFLAAGFKGLRVNRGIGTYLNYARNSLRSGTLSSEFRAEQSVDNHVFSGGLRYAQYRFEDALNEYNLIDSAGFILPNNARIFNLNQAIKRANTLRIEQLTGFLQDSYSISSHSDLQVGLRANFNTLSRQLLLSPRLLLAYRPPSNDKIFRFTAGIYQQPPDYRSIRAYDGSLNRDQKAQRSYNFSAGLDYAFDALGTRLKWSAEAYFKYADRLIPYVIDNMRINYLTTKQAHGRTYGVDFNVSGEFVKDLVSSFRLSLMKAEQDILGDWYLKPVSKGYTETIYPGYLKRPTDQRVNFSIFFQDRLLKRDSYKVHLTLLYGARLPLSAPLSETYTDHFYLPAYKRVDIGFSKDFLDDNSLKKPMFLNRYFNAFVASLEVFNLFDMNNTVSYLWLKDVDNVQYAIPNYLTGRQVNLKLILKFRNQR